MEQAYMDLIINPDLAHERTTRILEAARGEIDLIYVAEDMGSQSSLLFSPQQIEEFFVPGFRRMIELGIDVLNPIQWRCDGIDRAELKQAFGDRLVFHGAMDNQTPLPFASREEVIAEVHENIELLGSGGGYVLAPCHNLQSITPVENIVAMYETVWEHGRY